MKRVKDHRYLYRRDAMFYFRRVVPEVARSAFGKSEVQVSLQTTKLAEARHLLLAELEKFEAKLSEVAGGVSPVEIIRASRSHTPTKQDVEGSVRSWLTARMDRFSLSNVQSSAEAEDRSNELEAHENDVVRGMTAGGLEPTLTTSWIAEELIAREGWKIEPGSDLYRHLIRTVGRGQVEAARRHGQDLYGAPRSTTDETFSADEYRRDAERAREQRERTPTSLRSLFEGYIKESDLAAATVKAWTRQFQAFISFTGHDDARRVDLADVVAWKDHLLATEKPDGRCLSAKTVRDTYVAVVKAVFNWAVENGKIAANPAKQVTVRGRRKVIMREKGLNDAEARLILSATLASPPDGLSVERAAARRWVPWLCAYTGARVNEITQLRAEDVEKIGSIWTIRITPEAGSTKNRKARIVALHPHLIEQGFPAFVGSRSGPIFYDPRRRRGGSEAHPQAKKVGEHLARWVRELGVTDVEVMPNHGWRHRFKTQGRLAGMDPEIRDVIQGHVPRTEGEGYGDTFPEVSLREISKLPRYRLASEPSKLD